MKKFIRWQGLTAFVIIVAVFGIFWFFLVDGIVKGLIEKYGTNAIGAKVELRDLDLSLFPAGLGLEQLQVTDPDSPMINAFEVNHVSFTLEPLNLFRRKVIINEMTLDGIRFGTQRQTSGAIKIKKKFSKAKEVREKSKAPATVKSPCGIIPLPSFKIPDIKKILYTEQLQSMGIINSLQKDIQEEKIKWEGVLGNLAGEKQFEDYKDRMNKLKSGKKKGISSILGSASKLSTLQKDIMNDINEIKSAHINFRDEVASLKSRVREAKEAQLNDVMRLKQKYTLSPRGLKHLSKSIFGSRLCEVVRKAGIWYEKLRPVIERSYKKEKGHEVIKPPRSRGVNVRFKEYKPLPDFLIRKAKARVNLRAGEILGLIQDITPDQDILGLPLKFRFKGEKLQGLESINLYGILNHVSKSQPKDTASLTVKGYEVKNMTLSGADAFPLALNHALADLEIDATLKDEKIKSNLISEFHSVSFQAWPSEKASTIKTALMSSLSSISRFTVNAKVSGTLSNYTIDLTSDLDRAFMKSANRAVEKQALTLEKNLKMAVAAKMDDPFRKADSGIGGLDLVGKEISKRLNLGNGLLGNLKGTTSKGGLKLPF